jgi:ubiquinone/menaquinone biosynthesis C-methylase UbiE
MALDKSIQWDYSELAQNYERRAPYASDVIARLLTQTNLAAAASALDVGAGTGRLSAMLAAAGLSVIALEPNAAMRAIGMEKTREQNVTWREANGEDTGVPAASVDLVSYGSSLNVLDRDRALAEAARVLRNQGWMTCLWNHRDLDDPLQRTIETTICRLLPNYDYGTRRDDPTALIQAGGHFAQVRFFQCDFVHRSCRANFVAGFRAHATLRRQAADRFEDVLAAIASIVADMEWIDVPFATRVWYAQRRAI